MEAGEKKELGINFTCYGCKKSIKANPKAHGIIIEISKNRYSIVCSEKCEKNANIKLKLKKL